MTKHSPPSTHPRTDPAPERTDRLPHDGQGVVRHKGEDQPADKDRARLVSREDRGGDPPGKRRN